MCLLGIAFQTLPDCPLFLFANREESPHRPATTPKIISEERGKSTWLGGRDLQAEGTWLGVNEHGLIVAVTNRQKTNLPENPRSRGQLCRDLLGMRDFESAQNYAEHQLRIHNYAGCNFFIASSQSACVIASADRMTISTLAPGLHILANGPLNDPTDPRISRVRRLTEEIPSGKVEDWVTATESICGLPAEGSQPAICRLGSDWRTVSSTIIAMTEKTHQSAYHHADGPPATTAYRDYSKLMRSLFDRVSCD